MAPLFWPTLYVKYVVSARSYLLTYCVVRVSADDSELLDPTVRESCSALDRWLIDVERTSGGS